MFRKLNYHSISKSIINIQPMTGPTGNVFYWDYTYKDDGYEVDVYLNGLAEANEQPRAGLIHVINSYNPKVVREIVAKNYPQWLEELDKLLVLK